MGKWQKHKKTQHTRETRGQSFAAGNRKAAWSRQDSINNRNDPQRSNTLELSVRNYWRAQSCFTVPSSPFVLMWMNTHTFGSHEKSLSYLCIIYKYIQSKIWKLDKTKIRTQPYIQLNTRVKEIQHLNPGGPDQTHNIRFQPSHLQKSL